MSVEQELRKLLKVTPEDVDGVICDFPVTSLSPVSPRRVATFHFLRFQDERPRTADLLVQLANLIVYYCLPRERHAQLPKRPFELIKEAQNMFNRVQDQSKSGEFGELMAYFLLEGRLLAPQIVSKMALKTSGSMNVNGSDGIHLGVRDGKLTFYYSESKVYQRVKDAIKRAIKSVDAFHGNELYASATQYDFEVRLVRNHLDVPPGPLREHVIELLDPYSKTRSQYSFVNVCFLGYNWADLRTGLHDQSPSWDNSFEAMAVDVHRCLEDELSKRPSLDQMKWHFFLVPFDDVDAVRQAFRKELTLG